MRLLITTILIIILLSRCNPSNNCGSSDRYNLDEIERLEIYKETVTVRLGAFTVGNNSHLPLKHGNVDVESFFELKTLNDADKNDLFKVLINYDFLPDKINTVKKTVVFCYDPKNAILFCDNNGAVIGYVEICFECFGYKVYPSSLRVGEFCDEKFEMVKNIFKRNGIQYGISSASNNNGQYETLSKELRKHPDNPVILLSISKLKVEENSFMEAIKVLNRVIVLDSTNRHAYFLRGHSRLMVKDFEGAKYDFDRVLELNPKVTQAYHERALATIEIFETSRDNKLLHEICSDLEMVRHLGDSSITDLHQKYCKQW